MDDSGPVHWRRDASTTRSVRVLWALGVGTFLAAIVLIVFGRFFALTAEIGGQSTFIAAFAAITLVILAVAFAGRTEDRLERLSRFVPYWTPSGDGLERVVDALVGAFVMGVLIFSLVLYVGPGIGFGLATATIPIAFVLIVLSSFLQSVGALDLEEERLYLYEPEAAVDLEVVEDVSVRRVGDAAIVKLVYDRPDGQYVQGPRRLVVPPGIARELQAIVRS